MNKTEEKILDDACVRSRLRKYIYRVFYRARSRSANPFRNHVKVGIDFVFAGRRFLGARRAAAPYRQAAPIVNGVRMRWAGGKLVPRA